jgi:NTE family protein
VTTAGAAAGEVPDDDDTVEATDDGTPTAAGAAVDAGDADVRPPLRPVEAADLLGQVPLFADLPEHVCLELARAGRWRHLPGGVFLFHQGDDADALALLWSGRLDVVDEETHAVLDVLGRGSWVGELALLTGEPRSAAVRARRDCVLLVIPAAAFSRALQAEPQLGLTLARTLARQVQRSRPAPAPPSEPDTVAVIPLADGLPTEDLVWRLAGNMARFGPVAVVGDDGAVLQSDGPNLGPIHPPGDPASRVPDESPDDDATGTRSGAAADGSGLAHVQRAWARRVDELESEHPWVVLLATDPGAGGPWAPFCVRSADRIVVLAGDRRPAALPAWAVDLLGHRHPDVSFVTPRLRAGAMDPVIDGLTPRARHHLVPGRGFPASADRLARRVSGHALGIVLSGGGARGLAHLGVLERLVTAGATIDRVGGCSAGAFAAALVALGIPPAEMISICRAELVDRRPFTDFTVPRESLIRGRKTMAMLTRVFGDARIEELSLPYFAVTSDLATGELVVHREGLVREAVAASMSIPGFSPPLPVGDRLLVDGGLLDNLPVDVMAAETEGAVIAVDVMRRFPVPGDGGAPGIVSTISRAVVLGGWQRVEDNRERADVLITPEVDDVGLFEFDRIDELVEAGRRAADEALRSEQLAPYVG